MQMIDKKDIWVVVPAYNEQPYLARVLPKILRQTSNVILVDDGSVDDTTVIAQRYLANVLTHRVNLGKGAALKTGCEYAFEYMGAKAVVIMDADDQHDPAELPLFFQKLDGKAEVVLGVRTTDQHMPFLRKWANHLSSYAIQLLFGHYIPDIPSGYKGFTHQAYQHIKWDATGYEVELELAARMAKHQVAFDTIEIQTIYHDMNKGMTMLDVLQMLLHVVNWRFSL